MKNTELQSTPMRVGLLNSQHRAAFLKTGRGRRCASTLGEGLSVAMLDLVLICVNSESQFLDAAKKHRARELCNVEIWRQLAWSESCCAGMCLAFLADAGVLPLRMHRTASGKGPKSYWIN